MAAPLPDVPVLRIPENRAGRDFVVSDIHGCFDAVIAAMRASAFDPARDRILSVGDLIDRGPDSHRAARFLSLPYVFAVRGNHEGILLEAYADGEPHPAILDYLHSRNGFDWWRGTAQDVRMAIVEAVRGMPIALQVGEGPDAVGIVHADVPKGMSWQGLVERLEGGDEDLADAVTWGRDRLNMKDASGVEGIGRVFVGHTPIPEILCLGNVVAIDTGAVFGLKDPSQGRLTFVEARSPAFDPAPGPMRP